MQIHNKQLINFIQIHISHYYRKFICQIKPKKYLISI